MNQAKLAKLAKLSTNSNPHLMQLTLSSNQQGSNVVQINNYMSGTSKIKESPNPLHSKTGMMSGSMAQKNMQNRNTQVIDVIRKTGFRNMSNLRTYNDA
jgi:hypothetical protein